MSTSSTSKKSGLVSTSSPALRMVMELRSRLLGRVVALPRIEVWALTGAR